MQDATFEAREPHRGGAELVGGCRERDPCGEPMLAQLGGARNLVRIGEDIEDLASDVAFQASQDLAVGFTLFAPAAHVGRGRRVVVGQADHGDAPQGVVGLAIAAAVESVTDGLTGGRLNRTGTAQGGERGLGVHTIGVVTSGNRQRRGDLRPDPVGCQQRRVRLGAQAGDVTVEFGGGDVEPELLERLIRGLQIDAVDVVASQWVDNGPGWVAVLFPNAEAVLAIDPDAAVLGGLEVGVVGAHPGGAPEEF